MTTVKLLNVPFESNYKDTVWFPSESAQVSYFNGKVVKTFTDFSYQRKDNIIRVPAHVDTLYNCNYVMYQNSNISNKWFYAFIVDMKFVNDERTDITIETDVMQTWAFDYTVKTSFVEREHVIDDTPGLHTVPEQIEHGEYRCTNSVDVGASKNGGDCMIIASTVDLSEKIGLDWFDKFDDAKGGLYNGVYSGLTYYAVPRDNDVKHITKLLREVDSEGQGEAIHSIFMCPTGYLDLATDSEGKTFATVNEYRIGVVDTQSGAKVLQTSNMSFARPTDIDGHNVRNKKLLTYPYCYLLASNNSGASNTYEYELFEEGNVSFKVESAVTPGMSVRLIPLDYAGQSENHIEGLTLGKFPICAWSSDVFTNWLTQQSVNIGIDVASAGTQIGLGVASLLTGVGSIAGVGMIASGVNSIKGTIGEVYAHSTIPPVSKGNINSGDVTYASDKTRFTLCQMSIKREYANIIDEYFDMFGYQVNRVKVPYSNHRPYYWYTKTLDVNIDGAIPNKDLEKIKQTYDKGITFWRHNVTMGDYLVRNYYPDEE